MFASAKMGSAALGGMFFVSGAVALLYQAAWQREFTLLFGSAAPATAAVLAAYFAGLGLGSSLFGKLGSRWRRPLVVYGALELAIAVGALLVTPILSLYASFYPGFFARFQGSEISFLLAKGTLAFAALALPTMAMGGTFPVLAQIFDNRRARFGELAGWLYMLNTAGAAIGILAFPFLLGAAGMKTVLYLCIGTNLALAEGAFLLARKKAFKYAATPIEKDSSKFRVWPWTALAFVSGFITFVLQVGWSRAFAQVHENSIYSFSFIVALFIAAIAGGAQLARTLLRRRWLPNVALGRVWAAAGLLTIASPMIFLKLTGTLIYAANATGGLPFSSHLLTPAIVVVFLPVLLLAVALPLILQKIANSSPRSTGDLTGTVLAWNVGGSVLGALAAGFLFPYAFGLWGTIIAAGTIILLAAFLLLARSARQRIIFICASLFIGWLAASRDLPRTRLDSARGEKLVALKEGAHGVVAVVERSGSRRLKLNNHYVLGGTFATGDERMQAHIPLLLHPNPERVAFLGYGTGITAGGALFHDPKQVTAVELVPEVTQAASAFFWNENRNFSKQSSTRVLLDDARNYLRGTHEQFDVIIGDLVVPWRQGEAALYTYEHFLAARARRAPGGLACVWLPMFQLGEEDFRRILLTFRAVFPNATTIWRGDFSPREPALALIGSDSLKQQLDFQAIARGLGLAQADPSNPQLQHAPAFWMHLVGIAEPLSPTGLKPRQKNSEAWPQVEMRMNRPTLFVGRALQAWENEVWNGRATSAFRKNLPADAANGLEAGRLMREFTLLMFEGRQNEANGVQQRLRPLLGEEAARSVFGN